MKFYFTSFNKISMDIVIDDSCINFVNPSLVGVFFITCVRIFARTLVLDDYRFSLWCICHPTLKIIHLNDAQKRIFAAFPLLTLTHIFASPPAAKELVWCNELQFYEPRLKWYTLKDFFCIMINSLSYFLSC